MKNRLMVIFIGVHLLFIIANSVYMAIEGFCRFYKKDLPDNLVVSTLKHTLHTQGMNVYGKYTGIETGYGFFAPNVLSSGVIEFRHGDRVCAPRLSNYENRIRFSGLTSKFIQYAVQPPHYQAADSVRKRSDSTYYDLVLKNISVRFMQSYSMNDTLKVRLNIYDYPSLHDYAVKRSLKAQFITLYEKKYFLRS